MLVSSILFAFLQLSFFVEWNVRPEKLNYEIVLSEKIMKEIKSYKKALEELKKNPGSKLATTLPKGYRKDGLTYQKLVEALLQTKQLEGSAKKDIKLDGTDWTTKEFRFLSDFTIVVKVNISHSYLRTYQFEETLIFTNAPLLKSDNVKDNVDWFGLKKFGMTPDWKDSTWFELGLYFSESKYYELIERRLFPIFSFINHMAEYFGAIITIPCLGCDVDSAGKFEPQIGEYLNQALRIFLKRNGKHFEHIVGIYFHLPKSNRDDNEPEMFYFDKRDEPGHAICYRIMAISLNGYKKSKQDYCDTCKLFKIVESDPTALPGNGCFDEAEQSATTNAMERLTGVKGKFDKLHKYVPLDPYKNWPDLMKQEGITFHARENVYYVRRDDNLIFRLEN